MLRPDHLGCYGYARETSPNIDRLAANGVLFENAFSSTSWTLPAHAALFTGLADSVHGCTDTNMRLDERLVTMAERFRAAGYATAGFFSGPYLHPVFGLGQGFDVYEDCTSYPKLSARYAKENGTVDGMKIWTASHNDITSPRVYKAVRHWLRSNERTPFFLFIHLWDVHYDFMPPPPYNRMFDPDYDGTITSRDFLNNPAINKNMPRRDLEHLIALYDGEIAWTDEHIGKIMSELSDLGLTDSTVVVLLSDHGTEFFEHGLKGHRETLYDEVIHIPLIIRWPQRLPTGARLEPQVRIVDVLPTVLELAGLEAPQKIMGQSLLPLVDTGTLPHDNLVVAELMTDAGTLTVDGHWAPKDPRFEIQHRLRAFRRPDHKLIYDLNRDETQIFDLGKDPGEQMPVGPDDATIAAAAQKDAEEGRKWLSDYDAFVGAHSKASEIPPHVQEKLQVLGYVEDDTAPATTQDASTDGAGE